MLLKIFAAALLAIAFPITAAAGASAGAIAGEIAIGTVMATGGAFGLGLLAPGSSFRGWNDNDAGTAAMAGLGSFLGGAGGVWLGGEWFDGRSRKRGRTATGALGGAFVGAGIGTGLMFLGIQDDDGTGVNETAYMPVGGLMLCLGTPILATVGYNWAKRSSGGRASALEVTPAIAVLPPCKRGAPRTLTYGISVAF